MIAHSSPIHQPFPASATAPVSALTFLSYSHADQAAADEFRDRLQQTGVGVFQDATHLRSGDRWLQRLQQALAGCGAFVLLVGRDGVQRWVAGEVETALNRHFGAHSDLPKLPIHPVLLPGVAVEALPPLLALFQGERWQPEIGRAHV